MDEIIVLDPANYEPHRLHSQERDWAETNCYVDVWIELLKGLGYEPIAGLPFTLAIDFEGDQWTFFKYPLADLYELYGLDVQELAVWKPLTEHVQEQVSYGKPMLIELDSFHLPDTAGSAYKIAHVKSTVAITRFDLDANHMGYFHGQGYYHLDGEDFRNVFNLDNLDVPERLAPYVEIVKQRQAEKKSTAELVDASVNLLKNQLRFLPEQNPFLTFKQKFEKDLVWLLEGDIELFHQYSFATFRQFGACYELAYNYLDWLEAHQVKGLTIARDAVKSISEASKIYQFQLARAMSRKKAVDLSVIDKMAEDWQRAIDNLNNVLAY